MDRDGAVLRAGEGRSFPVKPFDVRVKVEAAETGDAFSLTEYVLEPGLWPGPAPHIHRRSSETFYVLDGELEKEVGAVLAASAGKPDPAKLAVTFAKHDFRVVERARA